MKKISMNESINIDRISPLFSLLDVVNTGSLVE